MGESVIISIGSGFGTNNPCENDTFLITLLLGTTHAHAVRTTYGT